MEIERKWMVTAGRRACPSWRKNLPCGRATSVCGPPCASGKKPSLAAERTTSSASNPRGGLAREEIERSIDKELFDDLEYKIIAKPLIPKLRRSYTLPDGFALEVNHVDEGQPTEFWYAEVEYPTVEAANAWQPAAVGLADYLNDEVTGPARPEHGSLLAADPRLTP